MATAIGTHGYRRLLKAASLAFKNDSFALSQAKLQLRTEFMKNSSITDENELESLRKGIDDIEEILRFNIVQGSLNSKGNYDVTLSEENKVVVMAGQDNPNGPELASADASVLGKTVHVNKVNNKRS